MRVIIKLFDHMASAPLLLCFLVCAIILPAITSSTKLCQKENYYYDDYNGKCRPCGVCKRKFLEIKPCSEFSNTMCIDPSAFTFLKKTTATTVKKDLVVEEPSTGHNNSHKWHEMETMDKDGLRKLHHLRMHKDVQQQQQLASAQQQSSKMPPSDDEQLKKFNVWDVGIVAVLCVTLTAVMIAVFSILLKQVGRLFTKNNSRNGMRNRLFSRDRLSTTEYMNSLATLDRRLAMDEILEKKKKALFEPQLLAENIYSDDVFVNVPPPNAIGGYRHHHHHHHHYEELRLDDQDHTRSLLRTTQQ